jgi:hypothetical protein
MDLLRNESATKLESGGIALWGKDTQSSVDRARSPHAYEENRF